MLVQIGSINFWQGEAGLAADKPPEALAILLATLVLYVWRKGWASELLACFAKDNARTLKQDLCLR